VILNVPSRRDLPGNDDACWPPRRSLASPRISSLRRLTVAAALALAALLAAGPAAGRGDDLAAARQKVEQARAAADAVAARVTDAYGQAQALEDEISSVQQRIADGKARAELLREAARRRARNAYTDAGDDTAVVVLETDDPNDAARRAEYLERINARDNAAVDELSEINEDLEIQRAELDRAKEEHATVLEQLETEQAQLDGLLQEAIAAQTALEERLARESEARRAAELAAVRGPRSGGGSGQVIGGLVCPVPGSAFSDSWGAPRSGGRTHQGTDLMAGYGTPMYAVIGGSVSVSSSANGGNQLYLNGTDGNTYFYAHIQSYAVSGGSVSQGQLIAYVGDTGNATGVPHLHFEIHLGGGSPINPYPTLASIC
jgi:peptidoglycan LD-endopeptidase LytH